LVQLLVGSLLCTMRLALRALRRGFSVVLLHFDLVFFHSCLGSLPGPFFLTCSFASIPIFPNTRVEESCSNFSALFSDSAAALFSPVVVLRFFFCLFAVTGWLYCGSLFLVESFPARFLAGPGLAPRGPLKRYRKRPSLGPVRWIFGPLLFFSFSPPNPLFLFPRSKEIPHPPETSTTSGSLASHDQSTPIRALRTLKGLFNLGRGRKSWCWTTFERAVFFLG